MAQLLLRRTVRVRPGAGDTYSATSFFHDTETFQDGQETRAYEQQPEPFNADPAQLLGSYCRYDIRVDVYHRAERDGLSRLTQQQDGVACPILPGTPPAGGTIATGLNNDPQAPPGATLLRRMCHPQAGNTYSYRDTYYDPATRTSVTLFSETGVYADTCTNYTRESSEVFDRWCLDRGTAPYTERRVSWNGQQLVFTNVEGVSACQLPACALTLAAETESAGEEGLGTVTLVPAGQVGELVYSRLGSSATQRSPVFEELPVGAYVFQATELRADGCVATVRVRVTAAYGLRYRLSYRDADGACCELLLRQRGYTGPAEKLVGLPDAVTIDWPGGALDHVHSGRLRGSECDMRLLLTYRGQLLDTFSGDERYFQVESRVAGGLFWRGYLLQEQYAAAYLPGKREFGFRATDGLAALEGVPFAGPLGEGLSGTWTVLEVLQYCVSRLNLELPLFVRVLLFPAGASVQQCALEQACLDVDRYCDEKNEPWSCGKVLEELLGVYQCRLVQEDGGLWLDRLADLHTGLLDYFVYAADGSPQGTFTRTLLREVTGPTATNGLYYQNAEQRQSLRGAVKSVAVAAAPGELANLLQRPAFLSPDRVDTTGRPLGWGGGAPASVLAPAKRGESGTLLLPGAAPGTTPQAASYIVTPPTVPLPAYNVMAIPLRLTFSVTVRSAGAMPANGPRLYVGLRHGDQWLGAYDSYGDGPQRLSGIQLDALDKEQEVTLAYGRTTPQDTQGEVIVRILQVAAPAGHAPYDIEISDIVLNYAILSEEEGYADRTTQESNLLVTRKDEGDEFFHTDTPNVRYNGTLLTLYGNPTATWFEPANPGQLLPIHSYLVNDRFLWQRRPAQVLSGRLRGVLRPGSLLSDPCEQRPAVYVLTASRYDAVDATWVFEGVQDLRQIAPASATPADAIYYENLGAWLSEANEILRYENA